MSTAVVIGGGVSGLSAAYYIQRFLPKFKKVIVLESSSRLGGWVNTTINPDGGVFEHGPRSLRPVGEQGKNTLQLAEELGLANDILPVTKSAPAAQNRYLYVNGQLCALPNSIGGLMKTIPPFSKPLALMGVLEPLRRRCREPDESIHSFINRRIGPEVADMAVDAMCRGIFAGDCRKLSIEACMPPVHKLEKDYGSLILGAVFGPKAPAENLTGLPKRAKDEKWATWSLRRGLQQLTDGLADAVSNTSGGDVRLDSPVTGISPVAGNKGTVVVKTPADSIEADLVVSSIYSKDLAPMLPSQFSELRSKLSVLESVNVVVVNLEYSGDVLPVKGFGHLLPSKEGGPMLGIVYDSCAFPEHNRKTAQSSTRLTVMMGGAWYDDLLTPAGDLPPSRDLVWTASQAASKHLGIASLPVRTHVSLQKNCIPQYRIGHTGWVASLEESVAKSGLPIVLAGSSYKGPAVNDCINTTRKSIHALTDRYG